MNRERCLEWLARNVCEWPSNIDEAKSISDGGAAWGVTNLAGDVVVAYSKLFLGPIYKSEWEAKKKELCVDPCTDSESVFADEFAVNNGKRKPIQIQQSACGLVVLCDDGSLWSVGNRPFKWERLPEIPQGD